MLYYVSPAIEIAFLFLFAAFCVAGLLLIDAVRKQKQRQKVLCILVLGCVLFLALGFYAYLRNLM